MNYSAFFQCKSTTCNIICELPCFFPHMKKWIWEHFVVRSGPQTPKFSTGKHGQSGTLFTRKIIGTCYDWLRENCPNEQEE